MPDVFPWAYKFQIPTDVARIVAVSHRDEQIEYELIGPHLYANVSSVDLRFIRGYQSITDGNFPDDFSEALSNLLAADLAVPMTNTQSLQETYLNMYAERLRQARFNGAVEQLPSSIQNSSWLNAHDGFAFEEIDPRLRGLSGT